MYHNFQTTFKYFFKGHPITRKLIQINLYQVLEPTKLNLAQKLKKKKKKSSVQFYLKEDFYWVNKGSFVEILSISVAFFGITQQLSSLEFIE